MLLEGKSAVIYGAEGRMGVARAIAREGARIFLAVRPQELVLVFFSDPDGNCEPVQQGPARG